MKKKKFFFPKCFLGSKVSFPHANLTDLSFPNSIIFNRKFTTTLVTSGDVSFDIRSKQKIFFFKKNRFCLKRFLMFELVCLRTSDVRKHTKNRVTFIFSYIYIYIYLLQVPS